MLDGDIESRVGPFPTDGRQDRKPGDRMKAGVIGSSGLHLLALLLVLGLSWARQAPPPPERILLVNLVQLGDKTAAPSSPQLAPLPQEKASEVAAAAPADAVPVTQAPPPQPARHQAEARSIPDPPLAVPPERKPELPTPVTAPKPAAAPAAEAPRRAAPADDLGARLERLARLRQPPPPLPPSPRAQDGSGLSNLTATSADAARVRDATYAVKDFIRAQVERRWNLNVAAPKGGDWVVAIHILLSPDGRVRRAEIVDTPRYRSDDAYRDFALSARNAVLLSSPLTVPAGEYDIAKDIVLDFRSKQVLQ